MEKTVGIGEMRPFHAVLCGFYGMGNLGDELLLRSMIDLFAEVGVGKDRLAVLSGDPSATSTVYGVRSVSRWSPRAVWGLCRLSRSLVLGGGGLFQDSTSVRSVAYYSGIMALASSAGCVPWVYGNSLGPLSSRVGRALAAYSLGRAQVMALRDRSSLRVACDLGLSVVPCPDPVTSLSMPKSEGNSVLVNLRPWNGRLEFQAARAIDAFLSDRSIKAVGVAMAPEDRSLMERLKEKGVLKLDDIVIPDGVDHPVWRLGRFSVGMRLHFNVLSALAGIPGTAIPYDPKVADFASSVGYGRPDRSWRIVPSGPDMGWLKGCRDESIEAFRSCWKEVEKF